MALASTPSAIEPARTSFKLILLEEWSLNCISDVVIASVHSKKNV